MADCSSEISSSMSVHGKSLYSSCVRSVFQSFYINNSLFRTEFMHWKCGDLALRSLNCWRKLISHKLKSLALENFSFKNLVLRALNGVVLAWVCSGVSRLYSPVLALTAEAVHLLNMVAMNFLQNTSKERKGEQVFLFHPCCPTNNFTSS